MPNSRKPKVKLGKTDGYRYIAFRQPLSDAERDRIGSSTLFPAGTFVDVEEPADKACTMLQYPMDNPEVSSLRHPDELLRVAQGIADILKPARRSIVLPNVVPMGWGNSSPFNPNPQQDGNN